MHNDVKLIVVISIISLC